MEVRTVSYITQKRERGLVRKPYIRLIGKSCMGLATGQKFAIARADNGVITLTPMEHERAERTS